MEKIKSYFNNSLKIEEVNLSGETSDSDTSDISTSASMSPIGFLEPYCDGMSITEYLERFEAYLMLQNIEEDKKKTVALIGVSGAFLYNKLKSVCGPVGTLDRNYSEVKPLLLDALRPKSLEVVERAKFFSRHQNGGETAAAYSLALRQLAQTCNFADQLDSHLRDRFIMGLNNEEMKRLVIRTNPSTFDRAISIAQTSEISSDVSNQEQGGIYSFNSRGNFTRGRTTYNTNSSYNRSGSSRLFGSTNTSYNRSSSSRPFESRFGNNFDDRRATNSRGFSNRSFNRGGYQNRRYRPGRCYECGSREHYRNECPEVPGVRSLEDEAIESDQAAELNQLGKFSEKNSYNMQTEPPLLVSIKLNGINFVCEVDTGASVSVIPFLTYKKYFGDSQLFKINNKIFTMADDSKCNVVGAINVCIGEKIQSQALILNTSKERPPLLGRTWLNVLFPNWKWLLSREMIGVNVINEIEQDIVELKRDFLELFQNCASPIKRFKVHLKLKEGTNTHFRKACPVPFKLRDQVKEKLEDMLKRDIIKKVTGPVR